MATYTYQIKLTSDAEPGTGLGGEILNELVPRDAFGRPTLEGSHIKGLMAQTLRDIAGPLQLDKHLETLFGRPEAIGVEGASLVRVSAASAPVETSISTVTRTAINDAGTALGKTLRTTEMVPVGTTYQGQIETELAVDSTLDLAWRLALLSIPAVGGNRSRGSGRCVVRIGEKSNVDSSPDTLSPGDLLKRLAEGLKAEKNRSPGTPPITQARPLAARSFNNQPTVAVRLVFRADSPICCPEITTKTNTIESGFCIPASAVQGMLLTHMNQFDAAEATAWFESEQFRAWPLVPVAWNADPNNVNGQSLPKSIRVSLTHRTAKFSLAKAGPSGLYEDEAISFYDWTGTTTGSPLKASDGVLLYGDDLPIRLWKAADMPRVVTAHGVHNDPNSVDGRNLFTMTSMAPMTWQGLVTLPKASAEKLCELLRKKPHVAIGKSRTVRGFGTLSATIDESPIEFQLVNHQRQDRNFAPPNSRNRPDRVTLFIVQSPLRLAASQLNGVAAKEALCQLVRQWAAKHGLAHDHVDAWPNAGIRFGWNRATSGRIPASYVILPGSVFALPADLDQDRVTRAIQAGIGDDEDRKRGFGAVVVHPGKAQSLTERRFEPRVEKDDVDRRKAVTSILELVKSNTYLPSPSQIRALQEKCHGQTSTKDAIEFLKQQLKNRTDVVWATWKPIGKGLIGIMEQHQASPRVVEAALDLLADLATVAVRKERG